LICLISTQWGMADSAADRKAADNKKLEVAARIEACTRLIGADDVDQAGRVWALLKRAELHQSINKGAEALADADEVEKLEPENQAVFVRRWTIHYFSKEYAKAEEEMNKALKLNDKSAYYLYLRGRARTFLDKHEEAMADFNQAIQLSPSYTSAHWGRGVLHYRMQAHQEAIKDFDAALAIDPYHTSSYSLRAACQAAVGKPEISLHDHAIAFALDNNLGMDRRDRDSYLTKLVPVGDTENPVASKPPKDGLTITFLQTYRKNVRKAEDMEEAIAFLSDQVSARKVPMPEKKAFVIRKIVGTKEGVSDIELAHKFPKIDRDPLPPKVDCYRAMWPVALPMTDKLSLTIDYDRKALDALWPLKAGNAGKGSGEIAYVAPDPMPPVAFMLQCKKPGDRAVVGSYQWQGEVVGAEVVAVPAGVFNTMVIRFQDETKITLFGKTNSKQTTTTWWYAPSIHWWVKREQMIGTDQVVIEAVAIE